MAECFGGRNYNVLTSNGGGEVLIQVCITLAERMDGDDDHNAVLAFLRNQMDWGDGGRSFNLYPPPAPIASPQRLRCLARIVAAFAVELTREPTDPSLPEIGWDRKHRMKWLANILDIHEMICEAIADRSDSLDSLEPILLTLTLPDQIDCQLQRLATRAHDLRRRRGSGLDPGEIQRLLGLIDQELALLVQEVPARAFMIANLHYERSELLAALGDLRGELAALKMSAAAEPDPESKELVEGIIQEVEEKIRTTPTN